MVDVCVIGGGLAGSTCALRMAAAGYNTVIFEKNPASHHKLCGEFLSGEVEGLLDDTELVEQLTSAGSVDITTVEVYSPNGRKISAGLPGSPVGVSRYILDKTLRDEAIRRGATLVSEEVVDIQREGDYWVVTGRGDSVIQSRVVFGAYGRRSKLDGRLGRKNPTNPSPWLAFKVHARTGLEDDVLRLYSFPGGYCGVSSVEGGISNMCWITTKDMLKRGGGSAESMMATVIGTNPAYSELLGGLEIVGDRFYSASQLTFHPKEPVEDGVIMLGDAAGMIAPVCGDGMAMAIDSANRGARLARSFLAKEINRDQMESTYSQGVSRSYRGRMALGRYLHQGITRPGIANPAISILARSGSLTATLIRYTRG